MKTRHPLRFVARFVVVWLAVGGCATSRSGDAPQTRDLLTVPGEWLDLPASPFVIAGPPTGPVLSNRTSEAISQLSVGCVRESNGLVEVVGQLFHEDLSHGSWSQAFPNREALRTLDAIKRNPEFFSKPPYSLQPCPADSRLAVTSASSKDGYRWSASGTAWPPRTH